MDKKIGVYLCSGCSIGDSLDMDALEKIASGEYSAPVCKKHSFLCDNEGVELIKKDIKNEGINTVVIGACSPRVNYDIFRFGDGVILERVNLRMLSGAKYPMMKIRKCWVRIIYVWGLLKPKRVKFRNPMLQKT